MAPVVSLSVTEASLSCIQAVVNPGETAFVSNLQSKML